MSAFDLIIRDGTVVTTQGLLKVDVAVNEGRIMEMVTEPRREAKKEISAADCLVLPGHIDAHVHFNEPGNTGWEGLETGARALSAGGGTTFCDMPLNSLPPVLSQDAFEAKRILAGQKSVLDFGLWGGLCPGHADAIEEMADCGAMGFKAFLCPSGLAEFPAADPKTLREGMKRAKGRGLPVAVHAEDPEILEIARRGITGHAMRDFLASRPKEAEVAAVRMACHLAGETGCALHVVHVSCAEALAEITGARAAGADVTAEVCCHHLLFDAHDAERIGARAKCAPPLRNPSDVAALWDAVLSGTVQTIGSDHSPAPPAMKTGEDYFAIWGGIAGCQHAWPAFLAALIERTPEKSALAPALGAKNPAERFRLPHKGELAVGNDADLAIMRFGPSSPVTAGQLLYRHPMSLYEGCAPGCTVETVIRRGEIIVRNGAPVPSAGRGKFLRPE